MSAATSSWMHRVEGVTAPAQARSEDTLDRFLDATLELLEHRPFKDISVEEICSRADRSVGSFYTRFADRRAVLRAVYARDIADKRARRYRHMLFTPDELGEQSLETLVEVAVTGVYLEYNAPRPPRRDLMLESVRDPVLLVLRREGFAEGHDEWLQMVGPFLDRTDHPAPEQAAHLALDLVLAVADQGSMLGPLGLPDGQDRWIDREREVVLRTMGAPRSGRRSPEDVRFPADVTPPSGASMTDAADELLDALRERLVSEPYFEITVRQVAADAGRHPTTFYAHFPNLSAAVGALVARELARSSDDALSACHDATLLQAPAREAVEAVVRRTTTQWQRFESLEDKGAILLEHPAAASAWRAHQQCCASALASTFASRRDATPLGLRGAAFASLFALHDHRLFFGLDRDELAGEAFISEVTDALMRILDLD